MRSFLVLSLSLGEIGDVPVWVVIDGHKIPGKLKPDGEVVASRTYSVSSGGWAKLKTVLPPSIVPELDKFKGFPGFLPPISFGRFSINAMRARFRTAPMRDANSVEVYTSKVDPGLFGQIREVVCSVAASPVVGPAATAAGYPGAAALVKTGCLLTTPSTPIPTGQIAVVPQIPPAAPSPPSRANYAGTIAAFDPSINKYRIARRVGFGTLSAEYQEIEQTTSKPAESVLVSLPEYKKKTGTKASFVPYAILGGLAIAGAVGVVVYRRRARR